ncbi:uncharacterized protein LOC112351406 [Selaginella moellendorffii]|uniref:uncharacterized protein LOC112351406 n=1 Tax=Selaginella moellendorffii TaxID=88036 RepID=UPI000D1C5269|nr:uncharacterized protein LOC112351406 [Selaginella moellendorffii]|eukprot:XP_024545058.1 uncharacterized protein LOC112351406 [Selaginella moellendorffii]
MAMTSSSSKKTTKKQLAGDAPWRSRPGEPPLPRISPPSAIIVSKSRNFDYALSIMKHPDPIGMGLAEEAMVEAAGPDCIIPGLVKPVKVLGIQVWPIDVKPPTVNTKALQPIFRELKSLSKLLEKAVDLSQAPFQAR